MNNLFINNLKKFKVMRVALLLFFVTLFSSVNAITINVTSISNAGPNTLRTAINSALPLANAGNTVDILFNAPGICQISSVLPSINPTSGTINFKKDPSATVPQGIEFTGPISSGAYVSGFLINNALTSTILIENLTFKLFKNNGGTPRYAVYGTNANNLTIRNCFFDRNEANFLVFKGANITLNDNQVGLLKPVNGFYFTNNLVSSNHITNVKIYNNTFYLDPSTPASILPGNGVLVNMSNINNDFEIYNNIFTDCYTGIGVGAPAANSLVNIHNNTINTSTNEGIALSGDGANIILQNNIFNNNITDLNLANLHDFKLVESPNAYGLTPVNTGNNFLNFSNIVQIIVNNPPALNSNIQIAGLNLHGQVRVVTGNNIQILDNEISSTQLDKPIRLLGTSNMGISPPAILTASATATDINVQYTLGGSQHVSANAEFLVEFYKSNVNGDLVNYIGTQTITTLTGGTYSAFLTLPSGVTFITGDRLAGTVTALHNITPGVPIGTSETSYKTVTVTTICAGCTIMDFTIPLGLCTNNPITFVNASAPCIGSPFFKWDFGDGSAISTSATHTYIAAGTYNVKLFIPAIPAGAGPACPEQSIIKPVTISDCIPTCDNCIGSFAPEDGEYILSAWVKEDINDPNVLTYTQPQIFIDFPLTSTPVSSASSLGPFIATGAIIDGWQRVEAKITIPNTAIYINIRLESGAGNCFFDDIRMFPVDGSMKSYVYDPVTLRLVAELDERNYATLYEYDEEGKLIRVKKETEKGIMTIKENKNSTKKK